MVSMGSTAVRMVGVLKALAETTELELVLSIAIAIRRCDGRVLGRVMDGCGFISAVQ
jgi:hypothetical protein